MSSPAYGRHSGEQALAMIEALADLYDEVHDEPRYHGEPMFSRPRFLARTEDQARRPGFELVTVHAGDTLAGFSFGFTFDPGRWWMNGTPPAAEILQASKFAVIELDLRESYRGRGWGRALMDTLLAGRDEQFATLAAIPDSQAHAMYRRWGWYAAGTIGGEGPTMDAMVLPLATPDRH